MDIQSSFNCTGNTGSTNRYIVCSSLSENDYSYNLDVKFGDCMINGKEKDNVFEKSQETSKNVISVTCKSGDLKMNFEE